ncbi:MAG: YraN family protein [Parcubacteria group bacterium]|nr:YraN family protein [Parcubacteria group bacterium]
MVRDPFVGIPILLKINNVYSGMFMHTHLRTGEIGEGIACDFLKAKGYKIIEINFKRRYGEIDIVTKLNNIFVFVEVKTSASSVMPEWQITPHKLKKFKRIIEGYFLEKKLYGMEVRADVILISFNPKMGEHTLEHIEGIEF